MFSTFRTEKPALRNAFGTRCFSLAVEIFPGSEISSSGSPKPKRKEEGEIKE